ncbi:MAG: sulfatase-like hydrolase/transferase [Oligoflexales bacterium]|nr:sulfatase-like hydrolase/transferase [Oligoflexales bacterium]
MNKTMVKMNLVKIAQPLKFLGLLTFMLMIFLFFSRVVLLQKGLIVSQDALFDWSILVQSWRFDIMIAAYVWLGFFILYTLLSIIKVAVKVPREKIAATYLGFTFAFIFFLEASTPSFFEEYGLRPNRLFFEYLDSPAEVTRTIISQLGWYVLPIVMTPVFFFYVVYKFSKLRLSKMPSRSLLFSFLISLPILVLAARGRLTGNPLTAGDANITENSRINELILNSTLSLGNSVYMLQFEKISQETYGLTMDEDEVFNLVKKSSLIPDSSFSSDPTSPLTHLIRSTSPRKRPLNFVIILEESLGADYVGILGGLPLTPNFDRWSHSGLLFSKLYSTGTRSANGIEAILSGFLPTPGKSVIKLGLAQHDFFTIAALLRNHGYLTSFHYGGDANFDNMQTFSLNNGFEQVLDQRHFKNPKFVGIWGASDEDLFDRAHNWLLENQERPVFSLIFTSSNHGPFEFPDGKIELFDKEKPTVHNAIKYADHALGKFLDSAKQAAYFQNTVFLVLADHNWRNYSSDLVPIDRMRIPGLIIGPGFMPELYDDVASQIDLVPTILPTLGFDYLSPIIGRNLRNLPREVLGRAVMQFGDHNAYLEDDQVIFTMPGSTQLQFLKLGEKYEKQKLNSELARIALAHALLPSALYTNRKYQYKSERSLDQATSH